ncbi:MAG: hypothetical protein QXF01_00435 [Candidatus Micrarchaeaceae archaeon]
MERSLIIKVFIASLLSASLLCWINGSLSPASLVFYLSIALPTYFLSAVLLLKTKDAQNESAIKDLFVESLYLVNYYRSKDTPLHKAIFEAANSVNLEIRKLLNEIANRVRLGEEFGEAIWAACKGRGLSFMYEMRAAGSGELDSIALILRRFESEREEAELRRSQSIQRYATVNMFVSTILPSFLIFGFIGSSILARASLSLQIFSVVIVLMLPFIYLSSNSIERRILLG